MTKKMADLLQALFAHPSLLIFFILPLLFLLLILSKFRRKPYPPGPKGWPLIGNMALMNRLTHRGLADLAKQYGGVFHLRMGFLHMVSVSCPDAARQVLQVHDNIFSNRPANIAITYLTYGRADLAFSHYGPLWRQMRKLCVMNLFSRKRVESWESVKDEVNRMIGKVEAQKDRAVSIGEIVFGLTRDIVYRAAFGTSYEEGKEDFIRILQEFSKLFGEFNIGDFIPGLGWMDRDKLKNRLGKARDSLDVFIDKVIDDHEEKRKNIKGEMTDTDMVDALLTSSGSELPNSVILTRNNIKAVIMDVMFGGTETVASGVEWAMAELLQNPDELNKVQQELTDVVGLSRKVQESDLDKLTYLRCCLKEVLRLHPPIPLLLHETAQDATISGYHIPARSRVMINVWAIGRDETSWEDAHKFKPARFVDEGRVLDFKGNNFEFIPFGSGRRSCPGMQLGLYALEMAVAHLLHCFKWELPGGMKPGELDMSDVFGLAAERAEKLVAVPRPRLLCPL